jgi:hypothetical protein
MLDLRPAAGSGDKRISTLQASIRPSPSFKSFARIIHLNDALMQMMR